MKYIKEQEYTDWRIMNLYSELINSYPKCIIDDDNQIDMDQKLIDKIIKRYPKCNIIICGLKTKEKNKFLSIDYRFGINKLIVSLVDDYYIEYNDRIKFDQGKELFLYLDKMYKIFYG